MPPPYIFGPPTENIFLRHALYVFLSKSQQAVTTHDAPKLKQHTTTLDIGCQRVKHNIMHSVAFFALP